MFENKITLYREADINGGVVSGGFVNTIPGRIKYSNPAMEPKMQMSNNTNSSRNNGYVPVDKQYNNLLTEEQLKLMQQHYNPLGGYGNAIPGWNQVGSPNVGDIYGPANKPMIKDPGFDTETMKDLLYKHFSPKKNGFEELIDSLFDTAEKEQLLIDMGYEFYTSDKGVDNIRKGGSVWNRKMDLDTVFMKEITIKFKNLLITKQVKKLKF